MNAKRNQRMNWIVFLLLALALLAGVGFLAWDKVQAGEISLVRATEEAESEYKTTTVRRNDLSLSVSGSGSVISAKSADLVFSVEGTVAELNVEAGDQVTEGEILAVLGDTDALKQEILDQTLAVQVAQETLDDLLSGGSLSLAQAQADKASAEQAYAEAQDSVHFAGDARCAVSKTQEYYYEYVYAQAAVDEWEGYLNDPNTGYGRDYILENLTPLRKKRDQAYSNYTFCQGYTEQEIADSQANLQMAKVELAEATKAYENLLASEGVDQTAVEIAEATLENAKLQLSKAQSQLAGTTITAPMNGTVITVNGKVGDEVDTSTFITISDLEQPQVQVYIDETDLQNFATGCAAEVTFDSLTGESFSGIVTQVSPALVTYNSASMVEGLVELDESRVASGKTLSVGMTASIEVTCHQAQDALVVPSQALYETDGESAYVYILNDQGQPEKREVVVGLKTIASAEITSGLSEGERIITSQIESN